VAKFFRAAAIHRRRLGVVKTPPVHIKHVAAGYVRLEAAITSTAKRNESGKLPKIQPIQFRQS
jgi:hypothetical protein